MLHQLNAFYHQQPGIFNLLQFVTVSLPSSFKRFLSNIQFQSWKSKNKYSQDKNNILANYEITKITKFH